MTRLPLQRTRLQRVQATAGGRLFGAWRGSWRRTSLSLLALLAGIYAGNNITSLFLFWVAARPVVVLLLVLALELVVRLRTRLVVADPVPLSWVLLDNLRLGLVYSVALEAFKLGS